MAEQEQEALEVKKPNRGVSRLNTITSLATVLLLTGCCAGTSDRFPWCEPKQLARQPNWTTTLTDAEAAQLEANQREYADAWASYCDDKITYAQFKAVERRTCQD